MKGHSVGIREGRGISSTGSKVRERVRRTVRRTIGKLIRPAQCPQRLCGLHILIICKYQCIINYTYVRTTVKWRARRADARSVARARCMIAAPKYTCSARYLSNQSQTSIQEFTACFIGVYHSNNCMSNIFHGYKHDTQSIVTG